jgi:hypothetical protein
MDYVEVYCETKSGAVSEVRGKLCQPPSEEKKWVDERICVGAQRRQKKVEAY